MDNISRLLLSLRQHGLYAEISDPMLAAKSGDFFEALAAAAIAHGDEQEDDGSPESGEELPEGVSPENGPVLMSEGIPLCGHRLKVAKPTRSEREAQTKARVDQFFDTLHPASRPAANK